MVLDAMAGRRHWTPWLVGGSLLEGLRTAVNWARRAWKEVGAEGAAGVAAGAGAAAAAGSGSRMEAVGPLGCLERGM